MEELMIKQLWQDYDLKLEKSLQLNYKLLRELQTTKAQDNISGFRRNQVWGVVIGIFWTILLIYLALHTLQNIYFVISVGSIALFNVFAVAAYIRHLALLEQVNVSDSITETQKKLATIQSSLNNVGRIMLLQTPFYCTFWYNPQLVEHGDVTFWLINIPIVIAFTAASIYLFKTLTYKNIHRTWVRKFIESFGGKKLINAMEFLKEIETYQNG